MKKLALMIVATLPFCGIAHAAQTITQTVDLRQSGVDIGNVVIIRGALSTGVRVIVDDGLVTSNHVYQLLARVYNNPQYCATPNACVPADLPANAGDTRVEATQFLIDAGIGKASGNIFFGRYYKAPEGIAAAPQMIQGNGVLRSFDAQIQIEVRDMDTATGDSTQLDQMYDLSAGGACGVTLTCTTFATSDLAIP